MTDSSRTQLDNIGPAAPPRNNGELVFEAPWQSRVFGLAVSLCDRGVFEWEEFRRFLINEIAVADLAHEDGSAFSYYTCWQRALERLVADKNICGDDELTERTAKFDARPAGHDH